MENISLNDFNNSTYISNNDSHLNKYICIFLIVPAYFICKKIKDILKIDNNYINNKFFKTKLIKDVYNTECSICLQYFIENEKVIQLSCKHMFHKPCIDEWININRTCPSCRTII